MTLSMTGFARQEVSNSWGTLAIEIRAVNHRYLETQFRMPDNLKSAETGIRDLIRKKITRGKLDIQVRLNTNQGSDNALKINTEALKHLHQTLAQVAEIVPEAQPVSTIQLLQWPGIAETKGVDTEELTQVLLKLTRTAIEQLSENRAREGKELAAAIEERLQAISQIVTDVTAKLPDILVAQRNNLTQKIADLNVELDPQRLEQEIVLMAQKADVAEELDRLNAHIQEARHLLGKIDSNLNR